MNENTPANKNMFIFDDKKALELLQLMLFGCLFLKFVTETSFNEASSLLCKWQWWSLFLPPVCNGVCLIKD